MLAEYPVVLQRFGLPGPNSQSTLIDRGEGRLARKCGWTKQQTGCSGSFHPVCSNSQKHWCAYTNCCHHKYVWEHTCYTIPTDTAVTSYSGFFPPLCLKIVEAIPYLLGSSNVWCNQQKHSEYRWIQNQNKIQNFAPLVCRKGLRAIMLLKNKPKRIKEPTTKNNQCVGLTNMHKISNK